jgi:hypothetical protein
MTKPNTSLIVVVLDRSASMGTVLMPTIEGFNSFLTNQKEVPGAATTTLVQFDDKYEVVYANKALTEAPLLTKETYIPRGFTALFDAIGKTIDDVGASLAAMPESERPAKVVFVVQTDGFENASKKYSGDQIRAMVTHQRDTYNWDFVFLGANIDAVATATGFGMNPTMAVTYNADALSTRKAFRASSYVVGSSRLGGSAQYDGSLRDSIMNSNVSLDELEAKLKEAEKAQVQTPDTDSGNS